MRILLWAPFGAGTHYWGPGTSAFRLYSSNKDKSIEITLVHASEEQGDFPEVYKEQVKLPTLKKRGVFNKIRYLLAARKWIRKNYHRFDVVHGISAFEYTYRPLLQLSSLGIPVFIKITGENGGFGNNSRLSMFLGLARNRKNNSNKITGFISISSHITQNLLNHGIERMRIFEIPNGVNIIRFKPLDHESKLALYKKMAMRNVFTFIYLGGLTFNKRIIEVVKAVALLKTKTVIDFQLFIVGPDREEGRIDAVIQKIINDSNLENIVFRVEHSENPERYIQVSDVFVLVSKKEGLSNALLEAMSCGLPVIGTEVSGSLDLIKRDINGVFSTGTSEDIAKCMHWYLRNTNVISEFGTASRKIIEDNYSHEAVLMQHIRLFSKYEKI